MIVILTGAGISKESGLDTFRDAGGLWQKVNMEDVATPEGFARNPDLVNKFHNALRRALQAEGIVPNAAHKALARLEKTAKEPVLVITQNIDDLHERGGSGNVLHMHGELLRARCEKCRAVNEWRQDLFTDDACPNCGKSGGLRPNIVWFGEIPFYMDEIEKALAACSTFVSIGTSGNVYPAAGFAAIARQNGAKTVELNLEPSSRPGMFSESHYGPATLVVPKWVDKTLAAQK